MLFAVKVCSQGPNHSKVWKTGTALWCESKPLLSYLVTEHWRPKKHHNEETWGRNKSSVTQRGLAAGAMEQGSGGLWNCMGPRRPLQPTGSATCSNGRAGCARSHLAALQGSSSGPVMVSKDCVIRKRKGHPRHSHTLIQWLLVTVVVGEELPQAQSSP